MNAFASRTDQPMALYGDTSRTLKETQELGEETLLALGQQREQFQHTQKRAREVSGFTKRTHEEIARMGRARTLKRCALWLVIVAQFATIAALFYRLCTNHFRLLAQTTTGEGGGGAPDPDEDQQHFP